MRNQIEKLHFFGHTYVPDADLFKINDSKLRFD